MLRTVLLTGGAGYIGRHIASSLVEQGIRPVLLDNFSQTDQRALLELEACTKKSIPFVEADIRDTSLVARTLQDFDVNAVIHLAALKSVTQAEANQTLYQQNNVAGTHALCDAMEQAGVCKLIFSSTAAVYEHAGEPPYSEDDPIPQPSSVYAASKRTAELNLKHRANSNYPWHILCLRYFNPIGAHPTGLMGENPLSNHGGLQAAIAQTYLGKQTALCINGNKHPTPDGSPLRDFLHIMDLASAHISALNGLENYRGVHFLNVGLGKPHSVLEICRAFDAISRSSLPIVIGKNRPGDISVSYCRANNIRSELGWSPKYSISEAMQHLRVYLDHFSTAAANTGVNHVL